MRIPANVIDPSFFPTMPTAGVPDNPKNDPLIPLIRFVKPIAFFVIDIPGFNPIAYVEPGFLVHSVGA
jgi:hypothetical protein